LLYDGALKLLLVSLLPCVRGASGSSAVDSAAGLKVVGIDSAANTSAADVLAKDVWVIDEPLKWSDAVAACENLGGSLATIHSRERNNEVKMLINGNTWVGGSDTEVEGEFRWSDDSLVEQKGSFVNWAPGEPNNDMYQDGGGLEDCIEMRSDGSWNDMQCVVPLPYVCEFAQGSLPARRFAPWRLPRAIEYTVHRHPGLIIGLLVAIIVLTQMANLYICAWKCRQIKKAKAGPDTAEDFEWGSPPVRMLDLIEKDGPLARADSAKKPASRDGSHVSIAPRSVLDDSGSRAGSSKGTDL
jgi:hypothetical protein